MSANTIKITFPDTPETLFPQAEEAAQMLVNVLRQLAALETASHAQYIRLCQNGRIVEFRDGVREEITDLQDLKARFKLRFAALLDPHCTEKLIARRRDCLHAQTFPSNYHCVNTGCGLAVTMKTPKRAEAYLTPNEGSVPFDLMDKDVRFLVDDMKRSGHTAQQYTYFEKFRFVLKPEGERWKLDEVYVSGLHEDKFRRDFYF